MAILPVVSAALPLWKTDYQVALHNASDRMQLNRAVCTCLIARRNLDFLSAEYRAITTALSDLLVLRSLHYRHQE